MWTVEPGDGKRPSAERLARVRQRHGPPSNELPTPVPVAPLVARSSTAAVAVSGARVFSGGVSFDLIARVREVPPGARMHEVFRAVQHGSDDPAGGRDLRLLLGVEFGDGRRGDNLRGPFAGLHEPTDDADRPELVVNGPSHSSGTSFTLDGTVWLTPVPADGPVTLVAVWPAFDVPETRVELGVTDWTRAAAAVTTLWPVPEDRPQRQPAPPPPPDVPADSWFAAGR